MKVTGVILFFILAAAALTNPTLRDFQEWMLKEKGIDCTNYDCQNEKGEPLEYSVSTRNSLVLMTTEYTVEFEEETKTVRALGIFSHFIELEKDNWLWKILK
ncbi:hypothetical protein [Halobacillus sp. Marseille-Q1614]|uniref:hypothetical protein n=1 Tax=Halobacillus sp. Marseille-Q1614 TaxID=2709134 RepID=UPI00156EFBEC|nr:hypothetical protein [Halobacillus sp. Marseille-Q1614]